MQVSSKDQEGQLVLFRSISSRRDSLTAQRSSTDLHAPFVHEIDSGRACVNGIVVSL